MGIGLGGQGLFGRDEVDALQTSSQVSRWAQDGSALVNINEVVTKTAEVLYTVSSGKKLFIQEILFAMLQDLSGDLRIQDDGVQKMGFTNAAAGGRLKFSFNPPLEFETNLKWVTSGVAAGNYVRFTITGWEE